MLLRARSSEGGSGARGGSWEEEGMPRRAGNSRGGAVRRVCG